MRKYLSYAFFGPLSKHFAGTRPLTDSERRNLLIMIYGLTAWVCYYQWRDILVDKAIESAFPIVDTDGTRYAAFSDEEPDFPGTPQTVLYDPSISAHRDV